MKRAMIVPTLGIVLAALLLTWRNDMPRVLTTIEIDRPVDEVFGFLTDLSNAPLWTVDLLEVRHAGPLAIGARGTDVRRMSGKQVEMPWEVTRLDPPNTVQFTYGPPFPAIATFTLEPTPAGSRLTCDTTLELQGVYRLLAPLVVWEARRVDARQFRNAKELLEKANIEARVAR
jgi:uncharacterized protein YndB with AHSA1/START domain